MSKQHTEEYGWSAVPRNRSNLPGAHDARADAVDVDFESIWPRTPVVEKAQQYVKEHLPQETYNHSLRVYCYGESDTHPLSAPPSFLTNVYRAGHTIVTQNLPDWIAPAARDAFFETWALVCLFHDLATTPAHRTATHMSFEFQGGFIALRELQAFGAPQPQAESVCEAIIRHQDPGETG